MTPFTPGCKEEGKSKKNETQPIFEGSYLGKFRIWNVRW